MTAQTVEIKALDSTTIDQAYKGSYYTIVGAGGELSEWIDGYEKLMVEQGIGKSAQWFQATGADVNDYFLRSGLYPRPEDLFQSDIVFLMFSLDSIGAGGKLAMFRIRMQDRWFDDIIDNMKMRAR